MSRAKVDQYIIDFIKDHAEDMIVSEFAEKFSLDRKVIESIFNSLNLPWLTPKRRNINNVTKLYNSGTTNYQEIAYILTISVTTVLRALRDIKNIEPKNRELSAHERKLVEIINNTSSYLTIRDIAEEFDFTEKEVRKMFEKLKKEPLNPKQRNLDYIQQVYKTKTLQEIADKLELHIETTSKYCNDLYSDGKIDSFPSSLPKVHENKSISPGKILGNYRRGMENMPDMKVFLNEFSKKR